MNRQHTLTSICLQRMAAAFGKPRSKRLTNALAQTAQAEMHSLAWALTWAHAATEQQHNLVSMH